VALTAFVADVSAVQREGCERMDGMAQERGAGERRGGRDDRADGRGRRPVRGGDRSQRGGYQGSKPDGLTREQRSEAQARYDGPPLPEEITGKELDRSVLAQLRSLPEKLGQRVARHLAAAGAIIDDVPKTAYQHTLAARARASRLAVVREAVGEAAYASGEYSEALTELRAARRMNGAQDYLAVMADCERALGRPDRALDLVRRAPRDGLSNDLQAELTIVEAGARRDRGELDAALRALELAPIHSKSRAAWVVRLRYAYADTLLAADRASEALEWFHRTEAIDGEELTDAAERAQELEARLGDA
jgi:tetratricopeptide (TPR) repeat protein